MGFQKILNKLELAADIAENVGKFTLSWQKQSSGFDIFSFLNQDSQPVNIQDSADYLKLFMQVGEKIFRETKDQSSIYLCACTMGGKNLLVKPFETAEQDQFKYSYIVLSNALEQLPEEDRQQLNFYAEINFENTKNERFERESQKTAKLLKEDNRDDWLVIATNKYDFLKTDMYVFTLLRLHSWGFQAIKPGDVVDSKYSMVRPIRPKPRGAARVKRRTKGN